MSENTSPPPRKFKVTVYEPNDKTPRIYENVTLPEFQPDNVFSAVLENGKELFIRSCFVTVEEL